MSVYIKGMEMPKNCDSCMFSRRSIHNIDWCVLTEEDIPCACPLVPIPPHGRLIDADRFSTVLMNDEYQDAFHILAQTPTIIPAEEGE